MYFESETVFFNTSGQYICLLVVVLVVVVYLKQIKHIIFPFAGDIWIEGVGNNSEASRRFGEDSKPSPSPSPSYFEGLANTLKEALRNLSSSLLFFFSGDCHRHHHYHHRHHHRHNPNGHQNAISTRVTVIGLFWKRWYAMQTVLPFTVEFLLLQ